MHYVYQTWNINFAFYKIYNETVIKYTFIVAEKHKFLIYVDSNYNVIIVRNKLTNSIYSQWNNQHYL